MSGHKCQETYEKYIYHTYDIFWVQALNLSSSLLLIIICDQTCKPYIIIIIVVVVNSIYLLIFFFPSRQHVTEKNFPETKALRMMPETEEALRKFYKPFNAKLYALLGVDYGWDDQDHSHLVYSSSDSSGVSKASLPPLPSSSDTVVVEDAPL